MRGVPLDLALRGAAAMAAAAISSGVDAVTAIERSNNAAQVLMADRFGTVSWMGSVLRDIMSDVEEKLDERHDVVASMGAAWSITIGGYPLSEPAKRLYERARAQRGLEASP